MKGISLFVSATLPMLAVAHPGHGDTDGYSIIHYFLEPMHSVVTMGAIAVFYAGYRYFRRKSEKS